MASQGRCSSVCGRSHSVQIAAGADDPCPCLPYCRSPLPSHGSCRRNTDLRDSCQRTRSSRSSHSHSSATWCTCEHRSCMNSPASRSGWGSRSSSQRRRCSSTLHCLFDLWSSRCSWEGIPAHVGWGSFVVMPSRARGVMPTQCWILNSCMFVGARKSRRGLDRIAGTALS